MNKNNKSGYTGVYFDNTIRKWRAQISYGGEKIKLGYFGSKEDAVRARINAVDFYSFNNVSGFKIAHFVSQRKNIPYNSCAALLLPAARVFLKEGNGAAAFCSFAIKYICDNYRLDIVDVDVPSSLNDGIVKDWLDGASINKLSKLYGINNKVAIKELIRNEILNKDDR